jgi:hypothetical protein
MCSGPSAAPSSGRCCPPRAVRWDRMGGHQRSTVHSPQARAAPGGTSERARMAAHHRRERRRPPTTQLTDPALAQQASALRMRGCASALELRCGVLRNLMPQNMIWHRSAGQVMQVPFRHGCVRRQSGCPRVRRTRIPREGNSPGGVAGDVQVGWPGGRSPVRRRRKSVRRGGRRHDGSAETDEGCRANQCDQRRTCFHVSWLCV